MKATLSALDLRPDRQAARAARALVREAGRKAKLLVRLFEATVRHVQRLLDTRRSAT